MYLYSTIYEKILFKYVVLSIAPATPGTSLPVVREITCTCTYTFRLNSEMCTRSIRKSEDNFIAYKENSQVVSILQTFQQIMTKM
jgi:hypothetical protein